MLASIVKQNADTAQALFLVSAIVFVVALLVEPYWSKLVTASLVVVSLGLLFLA
jgi:hypothetical protein